jgi:hypothetical protein
MNSKVCSKLRELEDHPFTTFNNILVFVLGNLSIALTIKYYFDMTKMYNYIRNKYIEAEEVEE